MRNTFTNAVINKPARTENGMKARASTANSLVDLFFKIGASRGKNILPDWTAARVQDADIATRIALWVRDIRGGAGERKLFRDILADMIKTDPDRARAVLARIPELGRWDDVLVYLNTDLENDALDLIRDAIETGNGLCAKWLPRQGEVAAKIRKHFGWTPKFYRKRLVNMTKVVETQMCAKEWDGINFNHVPSVASARYKKAFFRHVPEKYKTWTSALVSTDPKVKEEVKVNAGAVYPYDVIKGLGIGSYSFNTNNYNDANMNHIIAQWNALPNFVGDASILPLVDVSGSMTQAVGSGITAMDVAVSLGLYLADKNKGVFKDTFLTFTSKPQLFHLVGNVLDKIKQMITSSWAMNTNFHSAIQTILDTAIAGNVPAEEMPKILLILSDMQFDSCTRHDDSAMEMLRRKYSDAGYEVPAVVFWNLNSKDNSPVKYDTHGAALVSGFSPTIVKSVLAADMEEFTPEGIMMKTIMNDRYNF